MRQHRCAILGQSQNAAAGELVYAAIGQRPNILLGSYAHTDELSAETVVAILVVSLTSFASDLELIGDLSRTRPALSIVVVADGLSESQVVELLSAGAREFVLFPFDELEFKVRVEYLLRHFGGDVSASFLPMLDPRLRDFIGRSSAFTKEIAKLPAIAGCDAGVLILGETGTGKELFARAIHYMSARASKPWIAINCGAIPNDLVEDELFGHIKGAYTTAQSNRNGLIKEAEGGSLFLDDIDCLPMAAQSKLLRFLQEREYRAVGSNNLIHANVRIIAASNRDLASLGARAEFRQDLFFRLNVLPLRLPPLRERRDDIPALSQHFTHYYSKQFSRPVARLTPQALNALLLYDWPGNVRELEHIIERAVLMTSTSTIDIDNIDIPKAAQDIAGDRSFRKMKEYVVENFERGYIEELLISHNGNLSQAARAAGKNRRAFFALVKKYQIAAERFRLPLG